MSLQMLLNVILSQYFHSAKCLISINDFSNDNTLRFNNISTYKVDLNANKVIRLPPCQNFLLTVEDSTKTISEIENYIRYNTSFAYNERKYLILLAEDDDVSFQEDIFTFLTNILVVKGCETKVSVNDDVEFYELFTHNYKELRGFNKKVLLNKWFTANESFLCQDIDLYISSWKYKGREFVNGFVYDPPYIDIADSNRIGSEYKAMVEFVKFMNMTFVGIMFDIWGDFTSDWNATEGSMKRAFLQDKLDVYYGSAILTTASMKYASLVNPYMRMGFKCLVPEPVEANDWFLALNIKSYKFWLLLILAYLMFVALIAFERQFGYGWMNLNKLDYFGLVLLQSISINHLPVDTISRLVMVELLFATIIFSTIYNSNLASVITIPVYTGKINTMEDMTKQKLMWTAPTLGYAIPLQDFNKPIYDLFFLSTKPEILDLVRKKSHFGFGFIELTSRYYDLKNMNIPEIENYDVLKDDFIIDYTYFHLRKNSEILPYMNHFLTRITESGLHLYWEMESYFARNLLLSHARLRDFNSEVLKPLNMDKLKGHFVILCVGLFVSALAFIREVWN